MGIREWPSSLYGRIKGWFGVKWDDYFHPYLTIKEEWKIARLSMEWQRAAVLVSVIIAITMLFTAFLTYRVATKSAIPNEVMLHIVPTGQLIFSRSSLADMHTKTANVEVCVTNYGRLPSGLVWMHWDEDTEWTPQMNTEIINNLMGGNTSCVLVGVRCADCGTYYSDHAETDPTLMPVGLNKLKLKVYCHYCKEQTIKKTFDVCIFGGDYWYETCQKELEGLSGWWW